MWKKRLKQVIGNVDVANANGITGWAFDRSGRNPLVSLFLNGVPIDASVRLIERQDVAQIYGEAARWSGFFIDISNFSPKKTLDQGIFFSKLQVKADDIMLKPSNGSSVPAYFSSNRHSASLHKTMSTVKACIAILNKIKKISPHSHLPEEERNKYVINPIKECRRHGSDLRPTNDKTNAIRKNTILAFIVIRNESNRLPYFIDYYRQKGVGHFLFIDNGSTDGSSDYLGDQPDCSTWYTDASYKNSNFGIHWTNYLLHKYGVGHWCITVDPDEFLIYPHSETRNLIELTDYLISNGQEQMFCVLLDMYSDRKVSDTTYIRGQDPLDVCPYFDANGYTQKENASYGDNFIQGGPRRRVFFRDAPSHAPAINKTPLVYWKKTCNYISSTHLLAPKEMNIPHKENLLSTTGCLLHFKFFSTMAQKAVEEIERKEHYENSVEYKKYHAVISEAKDILIHSKSDRFCSSDQLCKLGMMTYGRWF